MIKAIAFDPGLTTGFATGEINYKYNSSDDLERPNEWVGEYEPLLVQTAQAKMEHADLMNFLMNYNPDYIICERFDFRQKARTGLELISREFIGIINLYDQMHPSCTLVLQTASQALGGYWQNDKLKRLNLYRKPIDGVSQIHANEACKHLLYWFKFGSGSQYGKEIKLKSTTLQEETSYVTSKAQPSSS